MSQGLIKLLVLLSVLLLGKATYAQSEGFDLSSISGRYAANLVTRLEIEVLDCPEGMKNSLPGHIDDFICAQDVGDIPFLKEADDYLQAQTSLVREASGWYAVNLSQFQHVILRDGYDITLVFDPEYQSILVMGDVTTNN